MFWPFGKVPTFAPADAIDDNEEEEEVVAEIISKPGENAKIDINIFNFPNAVKRKIGVRAESETSDGIGLASGFVWREWKIIEKSVQDNAPCNQGSHITSRFLERLKTGVNAGLTAIDKELLQIEFEAAVRHNKFFKENFGTWTVDTEVSSFDDAREVGTVLKASDLSAEERNLVNIVTFLTTIVQENRHDMNLMQENMKVELGKAGIERESMRETLQARNQALKMEISRFKACFSALRNEVGDNSKALSDLGDSIKCCEDRLASQDVLNKMLLTI